jgi:hypothetical protein
MPGVFDTAPTLASVSLASGIVLGVTAHVSGRGAHLASTSRPTPRRRSNRRLVPRRLHQLSFASSLTFLAGSVFAERRANPPVAAAHAVTLLVMSLLPLTSAGRTNHIAVATGATLFHGLTVVWRRACILDAA